MLDYSPSRANRHAVCRHIDVSNYMRIKEIHIRDYKGIDELSLTFPRGVLPGESDICVLGSKNGIGKTSLLECCAILIMAAKGHLEHRYDDKMDVVRCGAKMAVIEGCLEESQQIQTIKIIIYKEGRIKTEPSANTNRFSNKTYVLNDILGVQPDPIVSEGMLFMHGFRKIKEESPSLGMILRDENNQQNLINKWRGTPSPFKQTIIKYIMASADLFGDKTSKDDLSAMDTLDYLLHSYADVSLGKLRPHEDNTIDIMVKSINDDSITFSIDGLSSGQKEIISTLFLIWDITQKKPHIVLIDEPELHLNSQWHRKFIHRLLKLAPDNQYIIATHSEQIMDAVRPESRILLER